MDAFVITQLFSFTLIALPFAIANFFLANRINKNGIIFAILTLIPIIGYISTIYLFYKGLFYAIDKAKNISGPYDMA